MQPSIFPLLPGARRRMNVRRVFQGPSGRTWTVELLNFPATGAGIAGQPPAARTGAVLRFTADDLVLDLYDWPENWLSWTDEQLVDLARSANPPRLGLASAEYPSPRSTTRTRD